jgi:hypothetical protein
MRKILILAMLAVSVQAAIIGIESSGSCEVYTTTLTGSRITTLASESYDRNAPRVSEMCVTPFGTGSGGVQTRFLANADSDHLTLVASSLTSIRPYEAIYNEGASPAERISVRSIFRFRYLETFEEWFVITGGTGMGELRGLGQGDLDRCCTDTPLFAIADFLPGGTGPTDGRRLPVRIPFTFGEPFRVVMRAGGLGEMGSSAGQTSDAFSLSEFDSVFDSAGNRVFGAQIAVFEPQAEQAVPEPATFWLLSSGVIFNFFRRLST